MLHRFKKGIYWEDSNNARKKFVSFVIKKTALLFKVNIFFATATPLPQTILNLIHSIKWKGNESISDVRYAIYLYFLNKIKLGGAIRLKCVCTTPTVPHIFIFIYLKVSEKGVANF